VAEMNAKELLTLTEIGFENVESEVTVDTLLEISHKFSINIK
jgi:hypothetical protein